MDLSKRYDLKRIDLARLKRRWSKPELAREAGCTAPVVYKILDSHRGSEASLAKLVEALDLDLAEVVIADERT